ncbi:hypothetical protein [Neptuniibacter halophilus]|uniref:hypothetical protein n=1 Tax=Neptuniibacter halophilus TaxID=651666 RepID=UPI002572FD77|nr:hypothetical protein [Neptuniibacter halophilus]
MGDEKVYIRHPDEFPIELSLQEAALTASPSSSLQLLCHSRQPFHSGEAIGIKIPSVASNLEVKGTIQSCTESQQGYVLGIGFCNQDAQMRIRMLEQLCYIQRYRRYVLTFEGRHLTEQDAALEWIDKYAHLFPCSN